MKKPALLPEEALMIFASKGNLPRVKQLIAAGAKLVTPTKNAVTEAAFGWQDGMYKPPAKRLELIKALVEAGCPVEGVALFRPAERGEAEIVQILIKHGADMNTASRREYYSGVWKGTTVLGVAVMEKRLAVIEELAKAGVDLNQLSAVGQGRFGHRLARPPLVWAVYVNKVEVVQLLVKHRADLNAVDSDGDTALVAALEVGYHSIAKALIEAGADVHKAGQLGWTPAAQLKKKGPKALAKLLEQRGVKVPKALTVKEDLIQAADKGDLETVQKLIKQGADINAFSAWESHDAALHRAAAQGHVAIIQALLKAGAQVDVLNGYGYAPYRYTPLIAAARAGKVDAARALIAGGADVNATRTENYEGRVSALMYAAQAGHLDVVKLLVEKGAYILYRTSMGFTALVYAGRVSQVQVVKYLASEAAKLRKDTRYLEAAVFHTAGRGNAETLRALLDAGGNPNSMSMLEGRPRPAIACARLFKNKANIALLLEATKKR